MNIELLTPLADSIIKHWKIGAFESEILIQNEQVLSFGNNADYPQNYVF